MKINQYELKNIKIMLVLLAFALCIGLVSAEASLQVSSFSCSPSEVTINSVFSCTAQITNTGDAEGLLNTATLYPDGNNWLESSNYPQASGVTLNKSQSTEVTFTGLRAVKSGDNGFSKIMLDSVERTDYVSTTKVNVINVVVTVDNSASSAAMGGSVTSTAEATAGGNVNVILSFAVDSGGCSIGSQTNPVTFNGMGDGSKQSKVWTITQGTGSSARNCQFTVSASATGTGGIASKISSTPSTITCTDCSTDSVDSGSSGGSSGGSGGGGGGGGSASKSYALGELVSSAGAELASNERAIFSISGGNHTLTLKNMTETQAVITIESQKQTFTIVVGSSINVDLNNDGNSDVSIKLNSINLLTKKASFSISKLSGADAIKPSEPDSITGESNANGNDNERAGELGTSNSNLWIYWIIGLIVVIIIVIVVIILVRRRHSKRWY